MSEDVTMSNERLAHLESDLKHTQQDVSEIKTDMKEFKESNRNIELAIVELTEISRTNQAIIIPRMDKIEDKVDKNTTRLTMWAGGLTVLSLAFAKYGHLLITP